MKILIADDDPMTRIALRKNLTQWGYEVLEAGDGKRAWEILTEDDPPRLALLGWMMPKIKGVEICRWLHEDQTRPIVYSILLTVLTEKENIVSALNSGAYDYLSKPVHPAELRSRIAVGVRLVEAEDRLRKYASEMERLAVTDYLTGACSRRFLFEAAEKEFRRARRDKTSLAFMMIGIDHFKKINDTYGHDAGDHVLKKMTGECREILQDSDTFARFCGDEFAALMPSTDEKRVGKVAAGICKSLENRMIEFANQYICFTVSIGAAMLKPEDASIDPLLKRADEGLRAAIKGGRNRVVYT